MFVTAIVFAPAVDAFAVNVAVGLPELISTKVGTNVTPATGVGVTRTVPVIDPFAPIVNGAEALPTVPVVGPDIVTAVAAAKLAECSCRRTA